MINMDYSRNNQQIVANLKKPFIKELECYKAPTLTLSTLRRLKCVRSIVLICGHMPLPCRLYIQF